MYAIKILTPVIAVETGGGQRDCVVGEDGVNLDFLNASDTVGLFNRIP